MKRSFIIIVFMILIALFLISCKKDNNKTNNPTEAKTSEAEVLIDLKEKSVELSSGDTYEIKLDTKNATVKVEYTIEDDSIIEVNDGVVKALKPGKTNVLIKVLYGIDFKESKEFTLSVTVASKKYTITYESNVPGFSKESEKLAEGETKVFDEIPVLAGYTFLGWFMLTDVGQVAVREVTMDKDIKVSAFFAEATYTITYHLNGSEYTGKTSAKYGEELELGTPTKDGFTFLGWTLSEGTSEYLTKLTITGNTDLYANFEETEFDITYDLDGGEYDGITKAIYGDTLVLNKPTKTGYTFLGWTLTKGGTDYITRIAVNGNITLYANYKENEYKVNYELYGGTYDGSTTIKHGETLALNDPSKDGFTFLGWTLLEGSNEYVREIVGSEDVTVYADFKEIKDYPAGTYPIRYYLFGGHWSVVYKTPAEIGLEFMADFNASCNKNITPDKLDCAYIESSWFGDMMKNKTYLNKWMWLLDAIWEVNKGSANLKAATADFGNGDVKGFYLGNLNGFFTSTQHKDAYLGPISANFADPEISRQVYSKGDPLSEDVGPDSYVTGTGISSLPTPQKTRCEFTGWKDANGNTVTSISSSSTGEVVLVATWKEETLPTDVKFTNAPKGIQLYESLQLDWIVLPEDAANKNVYFYSLTKDIVSITDKGKVKALSVGLGKIRVTLEANPDFEYILEIEVWSGEYFDVSYETNSYVTVDETIKLNASYITKDRKQNTVTWSSLTPDIATVEDGVVTGLSEGLATIRATYKDGIYFDFYVTVLGNNYSDIIKFIIDNHISNAQTTYNLGIGDGNPEYYYDVVGGVSNLLFDALKYDYRYYDKLPEGTKNYGVMSSVEFITVHYTGNMVSGADADNNCSYFNNLEYRASIHYVTGRTNLSDLTGQSSGYNPDAYYAFAGLNEKYAGWHATNADPAIWDDTGLTVLDSDPLTPIISISSNNKYTINGRETTISIPTPPSGYQVNGNVLTVGGKQYTVFNQYGLVTKVVDGKYYLARTHWGTQRDPKCICTCGGNKNSIGIESCVDKGSDLEHTWHVTAQLVAELLVKYDLSFDRVVGHHFFSGKDCPQPFLERDMKLWYEFMDMVKAEYELLTKYSTAKITCKAVNGDGILRDNGLLVQDENAHCVTYEVTVNVGGVEQKITLATVVESYFKYDGTRTQESLQLLGSPII